MTRSIYYTATTLDGYIADENDSLAWLFEQETDEGGPAGYKTFIAGIGAMVMGATTYTWIGEHMRSTGEPWAYDIPCWVFTHRELEPLGEGIRFVSGDLREHHAAIAESAGDRDIWVVGGGDLAGQFADLGPAGPGDAVDRAGHPGSRATAVPASAQPEAGRAGAQRRLRGGDVRRGRRAHGLTGGAAAQNSS